MRRSLPFLLATLLGLGSTIGCSSRGGQGGNALYTQASADGLDAFVTDESAMQTAPCFRGDF